MDRWYSKKLASRLRNLLAIFFVLFVGTYAYAWKVLARDPLTVPNAEYTVYVAPGTTLKQFTQQLNVSGLLSHPRLMRVYLMYKSKSHKIKAGEYAVDQGMTALQLLDRIFAGTVTQYSFTIVEGWQTAQLISALQQHPKIKATLGGDSEQIINTLNIPVTHLEGVFLPDTYFFTAFTTDAEFLRRAYFGMEQALGQAWEERDTHCILKSPYEALILASIIEKETSLKDEYAAISGVYTRRLRNKMKLQADPTVIYALQDQLAGPLLRKHLKLDSPYNTYRYTGLPPTPIALPSAAAIKAALHPATGNSLYFVATGNGDGAHIFSATLKDHNKAVKKLYSQRN
ncbi:MAG TPA: endolytic transglycosylase MltG [Gammaproteobacteria bacterium]|nr:endolytic transglycosylase MltG [Gammaproteobacteria bacterium]